MQEKLLPAIFGWEQVQQQVIRLLDGAAVLGLPVLGTEQYRKGLGPTVPEVMQALRGAALVEKLTFSAWRSAEVRSAIKASGAKDALLCGIEAHVCVCQTCLDLLDAGYRVFVVQDATSSRTAENHRLGIERMRQAGAIIVSTEMLLFELLKQAGTQEFKQILGLVK